MQEQTGSSALLIILKFGMIEELMLFREELVTSIVIWIGIEQLLEDLYHVEIC